jgi:hypothetical protein
VKKAVSYHVGVYQPPTFESEDTPLIRRGSFKLVATQLESLAFDSSSIPRFWVYNTKIPRAVLRSSGRAEIHRERSSFYEYIKYDKILLALLAEIFFDPFEPTF